MLWCTGMSLKSKLEEVQMIRQMKVTGPTGRIKKVRKNINHQPVK
jgi:hypothetical protein